MSEELLDKPARPHSPNVEDKQKSTLHKVASSLLVLVGGVFAFVASQLVAAVLVSIVLRFGFGFDSSRIEDLFSNNAVVLAMYVLSSALLILLLVFVCKAKGKSLVKVIGLDRKPAWSDAAWSLLAYAGYFVSFAFIASLVLPFLQDIINLDQQQDFGVDFSLTPVNAIVLFVMFVIIPPIIEEVLFRGFMYRTVRNWMPKWVAGLIVSVLFGVMHLELLSGSSPNWIAMVDTTLLSAALVIVVEKTNSLWPAIYVHALKNLLAFTILISGVSL